MTTFVPNPGTIPERKSAGDTTFDHELGNQSTAPGGARSLRMACTSAHRNGLLLILPCSTWTARTVHDGLLGGDRAIRGASLMEPARCWLPRIGRWLVADDAGYRARGSGQDEDVCGVDEGPPVVEGDFNQVSVAYHQGVVVGHVGAVESRVVVAPRA